MQPGIDFPGVTVVFFCHDGNGEFVMHRRSAHARDEQGKWDIGGGRLETHDGVEATIRKEIMEEYCAEVLELSFLGFSDVHREYNGKPTHWVALHCKVRVDPRQVRIGEPEKFSDLAWFTLDALPTKEELHSQLPTFFENYRNNLR